MTSGEQLTDALRDIINKERKKTPSFSPTVDLIINGLDNAHKCIIEDVNLSGGDEIPKRDVYAILDKYLGCLTET